MRRELLALLLLALPARGGNVIDSYRYAAAAGGCSDVNCNPGSQALVFDGAADLAEAATGAARPTGMFCIAYLQWFGSPDDQFHPILAAWDGGTTEQLTGWHSYDDAWTARQPGFTVGLGDRLCASTFTGTSNTFAWAYLSADGTGETAGSRLLIYEETSADTWTQRCSLAVVDDVAPASTSETWLVGNLRAANQLYGAGSIRVKYVACDHADFGLDYNAAGVATQVEGMLGCSLDPAVFDQVWPMTNSSTTSEPSASGGTALDLDNNGSSIARATGGALWADYGSGEDAACDE